MKKIILSLALITIVNIANAQTNVVNDNKGSIALPVSEFNLSAGGRSENNFQTKYKKHSSGSWNADASLKIQGGQAIKLEVKNTNVLGTTITVETNHGTKTSIIAPLSTEIFEFFVFGAEPAPWKIDISTNSDAFIVAWTLYSTWIPGDPRNGK